MKSTLIHSNSSASLSSINSRRNAPGFSPDGGKWEQAPQEHGCANSWLACCGNAFKKKNIERTLPIIKWLPQYNRNKAIADLIAGVTVGLTVLPQGLAYATVAGLDPIYGLYSSFVGCFVYIFFGSTAQITIGPTAINSVLTHKYTYGKPPEYATFLCAVTAVVSLFLGIFRLGIIANFISTPVISGFTSAVALTIVGTQLKGLLGLKFDNEGFLPTVQGVIEHGHEILTNDTILGLVCIVVLIFMKKLTWILSPGLKNRPVLTKGIWFFSTARSALCLTVCTVLAAYWEPADPKNRIFTIVGHIPAGIPEFRPPPISIHDNATNVTHSFTDILSEEASALFVLPILGLMGHITIAKAFAGSGKRVDCTQEILTIGISNAISCFFSSYSIAGSFSRTTVNAFSGVASPMGGLYTGVMVLLALQFATQYFFFIPKASLAAVIISCVIFMVDLDIFLPLWRSKKMDLVPLLVTFLVTLFGGLEFGILTGFVISTTFLLYYAARPRVKILEVETTHQGTKFVMVVLDRSLTFPSTDYIMYEINKAVVKFGSVRTPAVIDFNHVQYLDFTAAVAIKGVLECMQDQGYHLVFYRLKPSLLRVIEGSMKSSDVSFVHCSSERDLETLIDGNFTRIRVHSTKNGKEALKRNSLKSLMDKEKELMRIEKRRGCYFE